MSGGSPPPSDDATLHTADLQCPPAPGSGGDTGPPSPEESIASVPLRDAGSHCGPPSPAGTLPSLSLGVPAQSTAGSDHGPSSPCSDVTLPSPAWDLDPRDPESAENAPSSSSNDTHGWVESVGSPEGDLEPRKSTPAHGSGTALSVLPTHHDKGTVSTMTMEEIKAALHSRPCLRSLPSDASRSDAAILRRAS